MATNPVPVIKVEIEVRVDSNWINFVTCENDIFRADHCGNWLYGIRVDDGWLVVHCENRVRARDIADKALKCRLAGIKMPDNCYILDRDMAIRAYAEGVKKYGPDWYENADVEKYSAVLQRAMFGAELYG